MILSPGGAAIARTRATGLERSPQELMQLAMPKVTATPKVQPRPPEGAVRDAVPPLAAEPGGNNSEQVELILRRLEELPTLSTVAMRLIRLTNDEDADFEQIIALIESDVSLSGRMLSLCRRVGAAGAAPVTTVRRAVTMLGLEAVQSLALSAQIYEVMSQSALGGERRDATADDGGGFDRAGFWRHSIAVACCAELLAGNHKQLKVRADEAFSCGLIHDLGKLVLDWTLPKTYARVLMLAEARSANLAAVERSIIGLDHHAVGKRLAEHWGLPHLLSDVIWLHGTAVHAVPDVRHRRMILLVSLADAVCRRLHLGWSGNFDSTPVLDELCAALELPASAIEAIEPCLAEAVAARCSDLGLGDASPAEVMVRSISAANARLSKLAMSWLTRGEQVRLLQRWADAVAGFAKATSRPGTGFHVIASSVIDSFVSVAGAGPCFLIWQGRTGEPWRLYAKSEPATDQAGAASGKPSAGGAAGDQRGMAGGTLGAPRGPGGETIELGEIASGGGNALGATVGLLTWLSEHAPSCPDLRTLRLVRLPTDHGPAAVLVHDRSVPGLSEPPDSLRAVWISTLLAAAQSEGSRRIADALAEASRKLEQTQNELAESQSLARLGELTAGAAHELNNPLTVVSGRSQLLLGKLTDPSLVEHARAIVEASFRLSDIITRLHVLSRDGGFKPVLLSLKETAAEAAQKAIARFSERYPKMVPSGVRVTIARADRAVHADRAAVTDAIAEVVLNALESQPKSGVTIAAEADPACASVRIQISDDGRGMTEHSVRHAFDPFFSDKPAGRSTGLGLTLARRLISAQGGAVRIRSKQGEGTTVTVELPVHLDLGASSSPQGARAA